jgi:hypothetical protein
MTERGWESDLCLIRPDQTAAKTVERQLASANYACVVIGAGVRLPARGWHYSRRSSTWCTGVLPLPPLPSIRGPRTAQSPQPGGCRPAERLPHAKARASKSVSRTASFPPKRRLPGITTAPCPHHDTHGENRQHRLRRENRCLYVGERTKKIVKALAADDVVVDENIAVGYSFDRRSGCSPAKHPVEG